jgi:hypothetical protein
MSLYESGNEKERMEDWQYATLIICKGSAQIYSGSQMDMKNWCNLYQQILTTQKIFIFLNWATGVIALCSK